MVLDVPSPLPYGGSRCLPPTWVAWRRRRRLRARAQTDGEGVPARPPRGLGGCEAAATAAARAGRLWPRERVHRRPLLRGRFEARWTSPTAPTAPVTCNRSKRMASWFNIHDTPITSIMGYTHESRSGYAARIVNSRKYDTVSKDVIQRWTYPMVPDVISSRDCSENRLHWQGIYGIKYT